LLVLTGYRELHLHAAVRQTADAVITKSHDEAQLVETIRALVAGRDPGADQ